MRKLLNLFFVVPVAIVLIFLSVANRHWVTFSLDPLNTEAPAFAISLPFFVFIFATLMIGALIGACLTWFSQGKHRKALRNSAMKQTACAVNMKKSIRSKKSNLLKSLLVCHLSQTANLHNLAFIANITIIFIFKTNNIIFTQIAACLNFNYHNRFITTVRQSMHTA